MENNTSSNIDFKNIWQQQKGNQPNIDLLLQDLKTLKNSNTRQFVIVNSLLLLTCIAIGFILYYYQPQLLTTKIGIVLIILAMVIYLFFYNRLFTFFNNVDSAQSNNDYLQNLIVIKNKQKYIQTTVLSLYFGMLSAGIGLYMYEYALMMPMMWAVLAYGMTLLWIGVNWFFFRPKIIQKQEAKLDTLIRQFENVTQQLND